MGKIIAFANQKGGVGKTTSAINVAASLGQLGKRGLLVDLDPQGTTTSGLGGAKKSLKCTTNEILVEEANAADAIIKTNFANLSVIPTNIALAGAEFELYTGERAQYRLRDALEPLRDSGDYDYIIIDCPPSLGLLTMNGLAAADGVIIPMQCEFYALEGLAQLMITVGRIKKSCNPDLMVTGILVTMYNGRLVLSMQVMNELKKHYGDKLFRTTISRNVRLTEAPGFGMPVFYHDKHSKGAQEYIAVANELIMRI